MRQYGETGQELCEGLDAQRENEESRRDPDYESRFSPAWRGVKEKHERREVCGGGEDLG